MRATKPAQTHRYKLTEGPPPHEPSLLLVQVPRSRVFPFGNAVLGVVLGVVKEKNALAQYQHLSTPHFPQSQKSSTEPHQSNH